MVLLTPPLLPTHQPTALQVTETAKSLVKTAASSFKAEAMAGGEAYDSKQGTAAGGGKGRYEFMTEGIGGGLGTSGYKEAPSRQQTSGAEEMLGRDLVGGWAAGGPGVHVWAVWAGCNEQCCQGHTQPAPVLAEPVPAALRCHAAADMLQWHQPHSQLL